MIRAMATDFIYFIIIYFVVIIGFSVCIFSLFNNQKGFESYAATLRSLFAYTLGDFDFDSYRTDSSHVNSLGNILAIIYLIVTTIIMLNLLIARMTSTYEDVSRQAFGRWSFIKAQTVHNLLLLKERKSTTMLPPPLNLATIFVYPLHRLVRESALYYGEKKYVSIGGTVSNVILVFFAPLGRLYTLWTEANDEADEYVEMAKKCIYTLMMILFYPFVVLHALWFVNVSNEVVYVNSKTHEIIYSINDEDKADISDDFTQGPSKINLPRMHTPDEVFRDVEGCDGYEYAHQDIDESGKEPGEEKTDEHFKNTKDQEDHMISESDLFIHTENERNRRVESSFFTEKDIRRICLPLIGLNLTHMQLEKLEAQITTGLTQLDDSVNTVKSEIKNITEEVNTIRLELIQSKELMLSELNKILNIISDKNQR
jgi:hypothetical protein